MTNKIINNLSVGQEITPQTFTPTMVQLFRFSAATANPHRIHYDVEYAQYEGYPHVLVQSHLHASLIAKTLLDWAGTHAVLKRFKWENRAFAVPEDSLTVSGALTAVRETDSEVEIEVELAETKQDGTLCVPAWATLEIPNRPAGAQ